MVSTGAKVSLSKFTAALRAKKAACAHTWPDILNHAARNVAFRAAGFTPKTTSSRITADLKKDQHLRYALTSRYLKSKGAGILKSPAFASAVVRFIASRAGSAGYLRAAYAEVIEQLGGNYRGRKSKHSSGFANKASVGRLVAQIVTILDQPNTRHAAGAERIGLAAIKEAIDFVAQDTLDYAQRKTAEAAAS